MELSRINISLTMAIRLWAVMTLSWHLALVALLLGGPVRWAPQFIAKTTPTESRSISKAFGAHISDVQSKELNMKRYLSTVAVGLILCTQYPVILKPHNSNTSIPNVTPVAPRVAKTVDAPPLNYCMIEIQTPSQTGVKPAEEWSSGCERPVNILPHPRHWRRG